MKCSFKSLRIAPVGKFFTGIAVLIIGGDVMDYGKCFDMSYSEIEKIIQKEIKKRELYRRLHLNKLYDKHRSRAYILAQYQKALYPKEYQLQVDIENERVV